jgi:hypothetical protein
MAVSLRIFDESEYGPEPQDIIVQDGTTITVRRHRQGADVIIEQKATTAPLPLPYEPTERRLVQGMSVAFGMSGFAGLVLHEGDGREHHFSICAKSLLDFLQLIDPRPQASPDATGRPDLRDMGATLVDKARARLLEAKAELLELESVALRRPIDGQPFQADRFRVTGESDRKVVTATFTDAARREVRVELTSDQAREITEHLLSMARFAAAGVR